MAKSNCWEFMQCELGPGGGRVSELGLCPCATGGEYAGLNGGVFAGRYCWKVLGTRCGDALQETPADKMTKCIRCAFFKHMREQAGADCEVSLLWSSALAFGIPLIDGQHHRLVINLEDILAAAGDTTSTMAQCLHFLVKYTHEHFQTEERLMAEHGFPGLAEHAQAHAAFREAMAKAAKLVAKTSDPVESTRLIKSMMVNWYVKHVTGMDQQYAAYFRSRGVAHLIH